jgi:HD-GYP domain-containing protein (c-di-GMP phosphodiesterase class II)
MPILVHVNELEPGMRLMQAVQRDRMTLLPGGKILEEWEINSLRRRDPDLAVLVGDPVLDEWVEFEDTSHDAEVARTVNRQMGRLMGCVRRKLSSKTALESSDIVGLQQAIHDVMQYITDNPVAAGMLVRFGDANDYLQEHTGNVFYISLLLGNAIREYIYRERMRNTRVGQLSVRYGMNLTPLALGCLFHDIGMLTLEHLYQEPGPLPPEAQALIREHPDAGAEMLPREFDAVARMVVRTHHENMDGSGYPKGIRGEHLHVFSRVIRVADALDAATSARVYEKAKSTARVLWEIQAGPFRGHYDPAITKILIGVIQPFPIGAKVRLNCGRYGVVVRHNRKSPYRPQVVIAFDEEGRKLRKRDLEPPIDLVSYPEVHLTEFAGEDLSYLYHSPPGDDDVWGSPEPVSEGLERTLFDFEYP